MDTALECLGLLDALSLSSQAPGQARPAPARLRARPSAAKASAYDF
ncbi:MAG: hypothetical protein Q8O34_11805 [Rhodocyclaceae bacterium]|nr:hypothetical protein [Rhodocyclaceae bacterium]